MKMFCCLFMNKNLTARNVQFYADVKEKFMDDLLLREICKLSGVSRRAIQGYEKAGLVAPSGKNKMGHLLYDKLTLERVKTVKQYQLCGFSVKEIQALETLSKDEKIQLFKQKLEALEKDIKELNSAICFLESKLKE